MALDLPDELFTAGEVIYQWITFVDSTGAEETFTVGCYTTIGTDGVYGVDVYLQGEGEDEALFPESSLVTDVTYDAQAPDLKEDEVDLEWVAGEDYIGEFAPASTVEGNTNHVCYFAQELAKIGRNPADFDKDFNVSIGARIYETASATTFTTVPTQTEIVRLDSPPEYEYPEPEPEPVQEEEPDEPEDSGAFQYMTSAFAAIYLIVSFAF